MIAMIRAEIDQLEIGLKTTRSQVMQALYDAEEHRQVERHMERRLDKLRNDLEKAESDVGVAPAS